MRRFRILALLLPILLSVAGAWFLLGSVEPVHQEAGMPIGWRKPTPAEAKTFHRVPEIGDRARVVPGSNGTDWEMTNRGSDEILRVHGHGVKNEKVRVTDRIADGAGSRELTKQLASGNDTVITSADAPDWVVDNWPGDGTADPSGGWHCASSGPRVEVVYMRPEIFDRRDQFQGMAAPLLSSISATAGHASYMHGGPRAAQLNVVCDGGQPKVTYVRVGRKVDTHACGFFWLDDCPDDATPDEGDWTIENARMNVGQAADVLQDLDIWSDETSYLVIWDGFSPCGGDVEAADCAVGTAWGQTPGGDDSDPDLSEPRVSLVPTNYWSGTGAMHELLHNMGAVQDSAPHNYNGGHCSDGIDIMCYGDPPKGDSIGYEVQEGCENDSPQIVDCGGDDYFNPLPKPGSYLAGHRNIATLGYFTFSGSSRCASASLKDCTVAAIDGEIIDEDRDAPVGPSTVPPTRVDNVPAG